MLWLKRLFWFLIFRISRAELKVISRSLSPFSTAVSPYRRLSYERERERERERGDIVKYFSYKIIDIAIEQSYYKSNWKFIVEIFSKMVNEKVPSTKEMSHGLVSLFNGISTFVDYLMPMLFS